MHDAFGLLKFLLWCTGHKLSGAFFSLRNFFPIFIGRLLAEINSLWSFVLIKYRRQIKVEHVEFLLINSHVGYLYSELLTNNVEFIHLIFNIISYATDISLKLTIIKNPKLLVDFIFYTVEINRVSLFL